MKIYEYPSTPAEKRITSIVNRALGFKKKDILTVTRILEDVRKNGDTALIKFTNRFDSPALTVASIKATPQEIDTAAKTVDRSFVRTLNRAVNQIQAFHKQQLVNSWINTKSPC